MILLHQCCAPCSIYPLKRLKESGYKVHGYFYNPNIHPLDEFERRKDTLKNFNEEQAITYTIHDEYGLDLFMEMKNRSEHRCTGCYEIRLEQVAKYAAENNFKIFTSTLLYSIYQNQDLILRTATHFASKYNISFLYEDYRKGWQEGVDESRASGMYRQKYCGCTFSEQERKVKKKK